jgi:hypothetical protein
MTKPKPILGLIAIAALASLAWAGNASASQKSKASGQSHARSAAQAENTGRRNRLAIDSGTRVAARLVTNLDAKKAKPGQRVVAKVTKNVKQHGHVVIGKNSKLIGHIVSAKASGKGSAGSRLEVAFDRLVQGKSSTALNTVVTSIVSVPRPLTAQPMGMPQPAMAPPMGGGSPGGGLVGGAAGAVGSTVGAAGSTVGSTMGTTGRMTAGAAGHMARNNPIVVTTNTVASGNASASTSNPLGAARLGTSANSSNQTGATSVFSRRKGNLQLHSGTQLQFRVVGSAHVNKPASHR